MNSLIQEADPEEAIGLLSSVKKLDPALSISRLFSDALNVYKGILVIFMTWAHTNLTLLPPAEQYYFALPHFIGNAAASLCFLGFVLSYGYGCDNAYLSDAKERTEAERLQRMLRSAALPVAGAWCCAFGWGWMCFKLPLDLKTLIAILDFRLTLGNGPDFLLCFSACMLVMFPFRRLINYGLQRQEPVRNALCICMLLLGPLALTRLWVTDCTGMRKYIGYVLECTYKDAWSPVLPALPHLLYFNLGLLLARAVRYLDSEVKQGVQIDVSALAMRCGGFALVALCCCYPLATVWAYNFGNISVPTRWGPIARGFVDGPSPLWLLGNIFPVFALLALSLVFQYMVTTSSQNLFSPLVRAIRSEIANLGANVLLYLVVADLCLAGLYRGNVGQFPLDTKGCCLMAFGIICITRFIQYLGSK